jgi:lysophospholipase L1-like esterase
MENPVYKAAMASDPDFVIILLGMNDSKVGNFDKQLFVKDYKKMISDFKGLKSKPTVLACTPTPIYIDNFTM